MRSPLPPAPTTSGTMGPNASTVDSGSTMMIWGDRSPGSLAQETARFGQCFPPVQILEGWLPSGPHLAPCYAVGTLVAFSTQDQSYAHTRRERLMGLPLLVHTSTDPVSPQGLQGSAFRCYPPGNRAGKGRLGDATGTERALADGGPQGVASRREGTRPSSPRM